jgi:hypothetical protein
MTKIDFFINSRPVSSNFPSHFTISAASGSFVSVEIHFGIVINVVTTINVVLTINVVSISLLS